MSPSLPGSTLFPYTTLFRSRGALQSMVEAWERGSFVTHPGLPDWSGPPWSLRLGPGWRELAGLELAQIVMAQWNRTTSILLDDLEALDGDRWAVVDISAFVAHAEREVRRLCDYLGVEWSDRLPVPLPVDGHL